MESWVFRNFRRWICIRDKINQRLIGRNFVEDKRKERMIEMWKMYFLFYWWTCQRSTSNKIATRFRCWNRRQDVGIKSLRKFCSDKYKRHCSRKHLIESFETRNNLIRLSCKRVSFNEKNKALSQKTNPALYNYFPVFNLRRKYEIAIHYINQQLKYKTCTKQLKIDDMWKSAQCKEKRNFIRAHTSQWIS